jgi:hypothetical protein
MSEQRSGAKISPLDSVETLTAQSLIDRYNQLDTLYARVNGAANSERGTIKSEADQDKFTILCGTTPYTISRKSDLGSISITQHEVHDTVDGTLADDRTYEFHSNGEAGYYTQNLWLRSRRGSLIGDPIINRDRLNYTQLPYVDMIVEQLTERLPSCSSPSPGKGWLRKIFGL